MDNYKHRKELKAVYRSHNYIFCALGTEGVDIYRVRNDDGILEFYGSLGKLFWGGGSKKFGKPYINDLKVIITGHHSYLYAMDQSHGVFIIDIHDAL